MRRLKNIYLVFYTLLLKLYYLIENILYLEALSINILYKFSNNIYNIKQILDRRRNKVN